MPIIQINKETCTKCGICVSACLTGHIEIKEDEYPGAVSDEDTCANCGACEVMCPTGSLEHGDLPLDQSKMIDPSLKVDFDQMSQVLKTRRSIRAYKDRSIPKEDINRLIDAARYAPTGANKQEVKWLVIDDKEKLRQLGEYGADFMIEGMKNIPDYIDAVKLFVKRREAGYDIFLHSAPAVVATYAEISNMMVPSIDCTIALSYFNLAANSMGLGCCWLGFFPSAANNYPPIKELISLPEGNQIHACMTVGYPKYPYQRIPVRNPSDIIWR